MMTSSSITPKIVTFFIFGALEIILNALSFFTQLNNDNLVQSGNTNNSNMSINAAIAEVSLG